MNQRSTKSQVIRFLLVGGSTVILDFLVYKILLFWLMTSQAKSIGYICGALYSYQFNRTWTFKAEKTSFRQILGFTILYTANMAINVWVNTKSLSLLPLFLQWRMNLAFIIATGVSATINFMGMKLLVFQ
jgi:putative flippase GtrA